MIISLLFLVLILALAFRMSTFGLFSGIIMTVLTLCCAAAALGTFEWVAVTALAPYWKKNFAYAIALGATFGIPMILLRLIFDKLITRACLLPLWIDRIGAGICGLVSSWVIVGIAALSLQMVPFDRSILGFERVRSFAWDPNHRPAPDSAADPFQGLWTDQRELLLSPDRVAAGVVGLLSTGLFSDRRSFPLDNPDFVEATGWVNSVPLEVSRFAPPGSIQVAAFGQTSGVYRMYRGDERAGKPVRYELVEPPAGRELRVVRLRIQDAARDERKTHVFTLRQFRLVGRNGDRLHQEHAIAIQQEDRSATPTHYIGFVDEGGTARPILDDVYELIDPSGQLDVVFAVPTGFEPEFVEYKHGARAPVSSGQDTITMELPPPDKPAEESGTARRRGRTASPIAAAAETGSEEPAPSPSNTTTDADGRKRRRGGNVRKVTSRVEQSFFGDTLPLELRAYRQLRNVTLNGQTLTDGHLVGEVDQQESGTDPPVARLDVPQDKRLLHLSTEHLQARSGLGRALSFAVGTVQNYFVSDENGNRYPVVGKYAIVNVGGVEVVEVQYFSTLTGATGGLGQFERIKDGDLKGEYTLVYLFLVDPGARITGFSTGGSATRADDLSAENLVAPR